jgi:hypothetical protein
MLETGRQSLVGQVGGALEVPAWAAAWMASSRARSAAGSRAGGVAAAWAGLQTARACNPT